ncbi:hypothetical protein BH24ACT5_BH24ACT5_11140 [soil metagenome]
MRSGIVRPVNQPPSHVLLGGELDVVSFVRSYVELRIDYSLVRLLVPPSGVIDGQSWQLTDDTGADMLRRSINRTVFAVDFVDHEHLNLRIDGDATLGVSLRWTDGRGIEALELMLADERGVPDITQWRIW